MRNILKKKLGFPVKENTRIKSHLSANSTSKTYQGNEFRIKILTLYPEMFPGPLEYSVIGRALKDKLWTLQVYNLRDFAVGKHKKVDGKPAGGGPGMVLRPDVVDAAMQTAIKDINTDNENWSFIYLTPRGSPLTHIISQELIYKRGLIILCGRFEGIDERVIKKWKFVEISIGDFVISGGEIAAHALIDSCVRLIPNVLGNNDSSINESFVNGLLEHPHFTKPNSWLGKKIPDVLLSGNHNHIEKWKSVKSLKITEDRRPDLLKKFRKKL